MADQHIVWHEGRLSRSDRERIKGHKGACLWFTGLSGSGKSTIANELEGELNARGVHTYLLDGDNIRHGLNRDLGFSEEERTENIRRLGEVAGLFVDAGIIVLTAFISPFEKDRKFVRSLMPAGAFIEIFVCADMETCEARDPKGLYKKARTGQIKDFTGIDSPYEIPVDPELTIHNDHGSRVTDHVMKIIAYLKQNKTIAQGDVD